MPNRFVVFCVLFAFALTACADSSNNQPPTVVISGQPGDNFVVGEVMNIQIDAQDPEGGELSFAFDWKPKEQEWTIGERAEMLTFSSSAVFKWDPLASDATSADPIQIVFIVTDEAGKVTEKTVTTKIVPGNGQPVFQSNVSEIYDPRTGRPLIFSVEVSDQDSADVELEMDQSTAPPMSRFMKTGSYEGQFTWEPSPDQLEQRIRTVRFTANDGDNPPVDFDVTIVVRSKGAITIDKDQTTEECPGEAVINHTPIEPQRSLIDPYVITADITGDRFDQVVAFYTLQNALNADFDLETGEGIESAEMTQDVDGSYRVEISNLSDVNESEAAVVSYQICAFDNDAVGESAIVCAPSSGESELFYTFPLYQPDAKECVEDGVERLGVDDDDQASVNQVSETWTYYRACDGDPDFHFIQGNPGDEGFIAVTFNEGSDIQIQATEEGGGSLPVEFSDCTGLATIDTGVAENGSATRFFVEVTGQNVDYQIHYFSNREGTSDCADAANEPNETAFDATAVADGDAISAEVCSGSDLDVYKIDLNPGDEISITNMFTNQNGNLDMTLFSPSESGEISRTANGSALTFSTDDEENITFTAEEAGTHYLLVFNNNDTANTYDISFAVTEAPPCPDGDQFSSVAGGNHTQDNAGLIPSMDEVTLNLEVCPGKDDWLARTEFFQIAGALTIRNGVGALTDITWEVLDLEGNVLDTATNDGNELSLFFVPPDSGFYYHRISTANRAEYELYILR